MTRKGKRDRSLHELPDDRALVSVTSLTIPAELRPALIAFAGRREAALYLEEYIVLRVWRYMRQAAQVAKRRSAGADFTYIEETMRLIHQVRLRMDGLSPEVRAEINTARHGTFDGFARTLDAHLSDAFMALMGAAVSGGVRKGRGGARPKMARDRLLHDVALKLQAAGAGAEKAAGAAAAVLSMFGIDAPEDPRKARAIVRKVEGLKIAIN